jgi:hypothetical protein
VVGQRVECGANLGVVDVEARSDESDEGTVLEPLGRDTRAGSEGGRDAAGVRGIQIAFPAS